MFIYDLRAVAVFPKLPFMKRDVTYQYSLLLFDFVQRVTDT